MKIHEKDMKTIEKHMKIKENLMKTIEKLMNFYAF